MDMAQWANCMLSWNALPPDPAIAGDGWREQWRERLEGTPHFVERGSSTSCATTTGGTARPARATPAIRCPVFAIGGWTDGYTDAVLRLLEHLDVPRRGADRALGSQRSRCTACPRPPSARSASACASSTAGSRASTNGLDEEPMLIAWLQDSVPPRARYEERPGRWVAEATWPPARRPASCGCTSPAGGVLAPVAGERAVLEVRGAQTTGLDGGAWCADGHSDDLPFDQRADDGRSLCFDSQPLDGAARDARARAVADLTLVSDRPLALVSVRLCEVLPGGASLLVTRGQLNLTHREGHDRVVPLVPGEPVSRARPAGRDRPPLRGRLAPARRALADVLAAGLAVARGRSRSASSPGESSIALPLHDAATAPAPPALCPPEEPPAYPMTELAPGHGARTITRELGSGRTELRFDWDLGGTNRDEVTGTEITFEADAVFEIVEDEPLSARVVCTNVTALRREADGWDGRSETRTEMTCDAGSFHIESQLRVLDGGDEAFVRTWSFSIPRDGG